MALRILVAEDEERLAVQVAKALEDGGYAVDRAACGERADFLVHTERYDLIVLDLGLPKVDGLTLLRNWRAANVTTPVLILTARGSWHEKVQGIDGGADDYVAKPFRMEELLARVRALLRRTRGDVKAPSLIRVGGLEIDSEKYAVSFNNSPIKLTPNEFKLLVLLASRPSQTLTREQLLEDLHGTSSSMDRSVDSHIKNLRKKLEAASGKSMIETVYGIGYRFIE